MRSRWASCMPTYARGPTRCCRPDGPTKWGRTKASGNRALGRRSSRRPSGRPQRKWRAAGLQAGLSESGEPPACRPATGRMGPMTLLLRAAAWTTLFAAIAGAVVAAQSSRPWTAIAPERLLKPETGDWMSYRRTYDVTAFSPLRQIDRRTVQRLRPVWSFSMRDNRRWLATPIVANGLMYVPEGSGRVTAFDAVTGDVVWMHDRQFPNDIAISEGYARTRGVSVYRDTIYWGTADSYLVALDARTGRLRWQ